MASALPRPRALPDWSAVPSDREEDRLFVNHRLAFFGRVLFTLSGIFYLFNVTMSLAIAPEEASYSAHPSMLWDLLATAVFGLQWLLCRSARRTSAQLNLIDVGGIVVGNGVFAIGSALESRGFSTEQLLVQISVTMAVVVTRAVVVPATGRRTLWLSSAAGPCREHVGGRPARRIQRERQYRQSWWDLRMHHVKRLVQQSAETPVKSGPRTVAIDFAERATAEA